MLEARPEALLLALVQKQEDVFLQKKQAPQGYRGACVVHRSTPLGDSGPVCTIGDDTDDILA